MFGGCKKQTSRAFPEGIAVNLPITGRVGSIPGPGAKTPHALWPKTKTEAIL